MGTVENRACGKTSQASMKPMAGSSPELREKVCILHPLASALAGEATARADEKEIYTRRKKNEDWKNCSWAGKKIWCWETLMLL